MANAVGSMLTNIQKARESFFILENIKNVLTRTVVVSLGWAARIVMD